MSQVITYGPSSAAQGPPLLVGDANNPLLKDKQCWTSSTAGGDSNNEMCNCAAFLDPFPNQITWR